MGSFDGIHIGGSGLAAQRRGVEIAGQNIANINTEGYTRQRVEMTPDAGPVVPAIHSRWTGPGTGVREIDFVRMRDLFLDRRTREELARQDELSTTADAYRSVESIFNEPSDRGLASVMSSFMAAWDDVANAPDDVGARSQLLERGRSLSFDINQVQRSLDDLQSVTTSRLDSLVAQVNVDAARIADMQNAIVSARASGINANELLDQRDLIVEGIAKAVGGTVRHEDDGTVSVFVGGGAIVRGSTASPLAVDHTGGTSKVVWPADGRPAGVEGEAKGLADAVNRIIPEARAEVATLATNLTTQVNTIHKTGFDRNGDPGLDFFVSTPTGWEVNPAIAADTKLVAASASPGTLDGSIALKIAGLENIDGDYREMIVRFGVSSQASQRRVQLQDSAVEQMRAEQESANGVNLDEELSDLVRFQRAYEASSRFISAIDDLLNTLVNGTGRVGR